jgi:hypothetical protein
MVRVVLAYGPTCLGPNCPRAELSAYIINQNHIFFEKLLWSHFWIDFYKLYTKTFGIVYILIGYLLIMLLWVIFICT